MKYRRDFQTILPPHPVVAEIGVAEGRFSEEILRLWSPRILYLVDAWRTLDLPGDAGFPQEWHDKNYLGMLKRIGLTPEANTIDLPAIILRGQTVWMADRVPDGSLDLAYLDASHDYMSVMGDMGAWWPKVKSGGIMATHDYYVHGCGEAFRRFAETYACEVNLIPEDKEEDAGAWIRKSNS